MMNIHRLLPALCLSSALLWAADALPVGSDLQIDPARTTVEFTLGSTLHTIHGRFQLTRGTLRFDPRTGKATGELVVDAASGDSGSSGRDKRMHNSILESRRFPEIAFRPDRVDGKIDPNGKSQVQLHGVFLIHGAGHELTLPLTVDAADGEYAATGTFSVPYVKWGMKNPSTLILRVNDQVQITVHTIAHGGI